MWFSAITCEPSGINFKWLFAEARSRVGHMKQGTLAGYMGITEQQLSMQLADGGHPSLRRLALAATHEDPEAKAVVMEIFALIADELGFGECHPLARVLVQALQANAAVVDALGRLQFKMARAELPDTQAATSRKRA